MADYRRQDDCVFCQIIERRQPANIVGETDNVLFFTPLQPYVPGHVLAVPKSHVENFNTSPIVTGKVMEVVSNWCWSTQSEYNILTSVGVAATQTVMHFHVHIIPRNEYDGLHPDWPWRRDLSKRDEEMSKYLDTMKEVRHNSIYTPDFVEGVQHGVDMMHAYETPAVDGAVSPAVQEAARLALRRRK